MAELKLVENQGHLPMVGDATMRIDRVEVTPALAKQWLANNIERNRTLTTNYIGTLAADMKAGRWIENHQPIALSTKGKLLDGQHRLYALIEADVTLPMWVAVNVHDAAYEVTDIGRKRTAADNLGLDKHHVAIATALYKATNLGAWTPAPSVPAIHAITIAFETELRRIAEFASVRRQTTGTAAVKAVVILRRIHNRSAWAMEQYAALLNRTDGLCLHMISLGTSMDSGRYQGNSTATTYRLMAAMWKGLDPELKDERVFRLHNGDPAPGELRAIARRVFEKRGLDVAPSRTDRRGNTLS